MILLSQVGSQANLQAHFKNCYFIFLSSETKGDFM